MPRAQSRSGCPGRDDAHEDLQQCHRRLAKLLLRRSLQLRGRSWTLCHQRWNDSFWNGAQPAERVVADYHSLAIDQFESRLATRMPAWPKSQTAIVSGTRRLVAKLPPHRHLDRDPRAG
jgi:hypothetical protein